MEENLNYKEFLDNGIYKIQDGDYKSAVEFLNESIKIKNDFDISYFYRAVAFHSLKDYDSAMLDYTKTIKLNPKMTDAYFNRAKIILEKEEASEIEIKKAIDDLNKAIELDNNFLYALYAMACAQKKIKDYHKALVYLEKVINLEPDAIYAKALKKLILQKYII